MNNIEIWKDVVGYEGYYEVSNIGRVRSLERVVVDGSTRGYRLRALCNDGLGYKHVSLSKNRKNRTIKVHRLVAQAFIPNPENKPHIDHINTIRDDNRVENLRWVTPKENSQNKITRKRLEIFNEVNRLTGVAKPSTRKVLEYNIDGLFVREWRCVRFIAQTYNVDNSNIYSCCNGKAKHCKGKIYRWKDSDEILDSINTSLTEAEIENIKFNYDTIFIKEGYYSKSKLLTYINT